ncbi:hypothetical protein BC939DRAFT_481094 [Gamsiella multidivaricata]|uniref:uncharacterized protein n=1 Tax=Gamsiella multidivaricata TaxID=101098 RepID=UPI00221EFBDB|nr:uncharacterized protein BC939DRAFT_481094 [Gamsiella multidivaricata]KAI7817534.1 hypothetical protein BC939DRAFT_481094 [Gamsiella multidivaricata]
MDFDIICSTFVYPSIEKVAASASKSSKSSLTQAEKLRQFQANVRVVGNKKNNCRTQALSKPTPPVLGTKDEGEDKDKDKDKDEDEDDESKDTSHQDRRQSVILNLTSSGGAPSQMSTHVASHVSPRALSHASTRLPSRVSRKGHNSRASAPQRRPPSELDIEHSLPTVSVDKSTVKKKQSKAVHRQTRQDIIDLGNDPGHDIEEFYATKNEMRRSARTHTKRHVQPR